MKASELDKNLYIKLLLKEHSLTDVYLPLISHLLNNDLLRNEIKSMIKDVKNLNFNLDQIYYI